MTQQPQLFPPEKAVTVPAPPERRPQQPVSRSFRLLRLLDLFVRVIVRLYLGLILLVLPWTHFWDDNHLLLLIPHLAPIALNGITRGVISGFGLLNIWIGISDAVHFKEN